MKSNNREEEEEKEEDKRILICVDKGNNNNNFNVSKKSKAMSFSHFISSFTSATNMKNEK